MKIGMKFTSKWFKGVAEIKGIDQPTNTLIVKITDSGNSVYEAWNLQRIIWGFERDEYQLCSDGFNPRYNIFEYSMDEEGNFTSTRLLLYEDPYKQTYHPYRDVKWKPARSGTTIFFENIKNARNNGTNKHI